jgi:glycosyltransferase involved in cell wall biosynthesis
MKISEPIDVIMCTWNSNKVFFQRCLVSLKKEVPLNHFIVIDRFSSDGTLEVVQSVFPKAKVFQTFANLAIARTLGIKQVETRYFAFIDDDIEVNESWFQSLIAIFNQEKKVGAIQGAVRYCIDYLDKEQMFLLGRRKKLIVEIKNRGYTHNTILKTDIMRDFNPPQMINSWEDYLMTQHLIKKGYRWLETASTQVTHYRDFENSYLDELRQHYLRAKWDAAGNRMVHLQSSSLSKEIGFLLLNSLRSILYCLVISIVILDPRLLGFRLTGQIGYLEGYLSADENNVSFKLRIRK